MLKTERSVEWCRKQMGAGNQNYTDAQIMHYMQLMQPIINFGLHKAGEQWKQNLKRNKKL